MKVVRGNERGTHFEPAGHWGCWPMRIHGKEETGAQGFYIAISNFQPDGGGKDDGMPAERVYYVLSGQLTIKSGEDEATLYPGDSVYRPANEPGEYVNKGTTPCTNIVFVVPTK